jgi:hypothetical protein
VSLDYLAGKYEQRMDQSLLDKVLSIQQLPDEDREHILYAIDGLIQYAKARLVYEKKPNAVVNRWAYYFIFLHCKCLKPCYALVKDEREIGWAYFYDYLSCLPPANHWQ